MKIYTPEMLQEIPIPQVDLQKVIYDLVNKYQGLKMRPGSSNETEDLMYHKDSKNLDGGFLLKLKLQKTEEDNLEVYIREFILFETPDEWLDAYNVELKRRKGRLI